MVGFALLILLGLPLDAAIPAPAPDREPLELNLRETPDGRTSTLEVILKNVSRRPLTVHPRWGCGGVRYDELFFDGKPVADDALPQACDDNYLLTQVLPPGGSLVTTFHPPFLPGEHKAWARFTVVDDAGKPLRKLTTRTLTVTHWW